MSWISLHNHSHGSLLDGMSRPEQIVNVCHENNYNAFGLTDHGNLSQCIKFYQACRENDIKPILGNELYVSNLPANIRDKNNAQRNTYHLPVLAKNLKGWKTLLKITSRSNDDDVFYYKPRVDIDILREMIDGNIIGFSGHLGSKLSNCLFEEDNSYSGQLRPDALEHGCKWAKIYQEIFGKENFFIEIQLIDRKNSPICDTVASVLREVSIKTGIPCIATGDSHYPTRDDAKIQRILLCSALRTNFNKVNASLQKNEDFGLSGFFKSDNFHIPTLEDMKINHTESELSNTLLIADMCENYELKSKPKMPPFDCGGMSEVGYLRELCQEGWNNILVKRNIVSSPQKKQEYLDRLESEFSVIERANLAGYFLVVQEFVNWSKKQGWLLAPGRGSSGGSLVSYLSGITRVDPIVYGLWFSRFYNEGRNTEDHISLPDIDVDVPTARRGEGIQHLRDKYGKNNVAQIGTYSRLQARAAIQEVLRAYQAAPNDVIIQVSKLFPEEAKVADKMEHDNEKSLILWTLKNEPEKLSNFCYLKEDGSLGGEFAKYFEDALRIEGIHKSQSRHAAGVIVAGEPIDNFIPLVHNSKTDEKITEWEMNDSEYSGGVKIDLLGNNSLDKLDEVNLLLQGI